MAIDDRPTITAPDDDPYLWLEEIEGERALDFVDRQSRLTLETFGGRPFEADRDALAAIYDRTDNIPYVTRSGRLVYNLWKDAKNPRGVWRRTTLADFRKAEPGWETLLDIDRLAAEEDKDWLLSWTQPLPGNSRVIVALSKGGSDAVTLREFDLDSKAFVADGFTLPEAKSGVEWIDADTLLLSSAFGEGMATTSGYAKTVRLWRRGEPVERAPVLFEVPADRMAAYCSVDDTGPTPRMWFIDRIDFFNLNLWLGTEAGPRTKLDLPTDIWMEAHQDWLVVKLRSAWTVAGKAYAPDSVLGISLPAFLAGDRNFTLVFEPQPRRALQGFFWTAGKLALVRPRRVAPGVRNLHAVGKRLDARATAGPSRNRRGRCLASRPSRSREQWRPARQRAGSRDAAIAAADRGCRQPRYIEAGAEDLFCRRTRRHPP